MTDIEISLGGGVDGFHDQALGIATDFIGSDRIRPSTSDSKRAGSTPSSAAPFDSQSSGDIATMESGDARGALTKEAVSANVYGEVEGEEVALSVEITEPSSTPQSGGPRLISKGIDMVGLVREHFKTTSSPDEMTSSSKNCVETMKATTTGPDFDIIIEPPFAGKSGTEFLQTQSKELRRSSRSLLSFKSGRKSASKRNSRNKRPSLSPDSYKNIKFVEEQERVSLTQEKQSYSACGLEHTLRRASTTDTLLSRDKDHSLVLEGTLLEGVNEPISSTIIDEKAHDGAKESMSVLSLSDEPTFIKQLNLSYDSEDLWETDSKNFTKKAVPLPVDKGKEVKIGSVCVKQVAETTDAGQEADMPTEGDQGVEVTEEVLNGESLKSESKAQSDTQSKSSNVAEEFSQEGYVNVEVMPYTTFISSAAAVRLNQRDESVVPADVLRTTSCSNSCVDTTMTAPKNNLTLTTFRGKGKKPRSLTCTTGGDVKKASDGNTIAKTLAAIDLNRRELSSNSQETKSNCSVSQNALGALNEDQNAIMGLSASRLGAEGIAPARGTKDQTIDAKIRILNSLSAARTRLLCKSDDDVPLNPLYRIEESPPTGDRNWPWHCNLSRNKRGATDLLPTQIEKHQIRNRRKVVVLWTLLVFLVVFIVGLGFGFRSRSTANSLSSKIVSNKLQGVSNHDTNTTEQETNQSINVEEELDNENDSKINQTDDKVLDGSELDGQDSDETDFSDADNAVFLDEDGHHGGNHTLDLPEPDPSITHATPIKGIFEFGEDISVWFSVGDNTNPQSDDWVTIFPFGPNRNDENQSWLYTCNDISVCDDPIPRSGSVVFNEDAAGTWPLPPGDYIATLYRGEEMPYEIMATSNVFKVLEPT